MIPGVTGALLARPLELLPIPFVDFTAHLGDYIPGTILGFATDLAFVLTGMVLPFWVVLGTVTGMIHTFNLVMVFGTGDARLLSGGISEALVTTEYGLIIAIPTLLLYAYFSRKVKKIIHSVEQVTVEFIHGMKS